MVLQKREVFIKQKNSKMKIKETKIIISIILILFAGFSYIIFHGTKNLLFVEKINSIFSIIPIFEGIKVNKIINGYFVDILWILAFNLLISIFQNKFFNFLVLFIAITVELLQLKFKSLGTFDYIDLIIYIIVSLVFIILIKKDNLTCTNV